MGKDGDGATVLRVFVIIFTILVILLALACIGLIIYGYIHYRTMWSALGNLGIVALVLLLVAVFLIVVVAMCGLCGACCSSRCCLIFFLIFIAIWIAALIALGVVAIVLPPKYFSSTDNTNCLKIAKFNDLQTFSSNVNSSGICSSACRCNFPTATDSSVYSSSDQASLATLNKSTSASDPTRTQDCSGWSSSLKNGNTIYEQFEKDFQCTGWCSNTSTLFYRFTNVNNGKPQGSCYNRVSYYIKRYATVLTVLAFVEAGLMLIAFTLAICYMCYQGKGSHSAVEGQATAQHINVHLDGGRPYPPYPPYPYK